MSNPTNPMKSILMLAMHAVDPDENADLIRLPDSEISEVRVEADGGTGGWNVMATVFIPSLQDDDNGRTGWLYIARKYDAQRELIYNADEREGW